MKPTKKKNQVNIGEFRNHCSAYLQRVRAGEEIIICDRREPLAQVIPLTREKEKPRLRIIKPKVKGALKNIKPVDIKAQVDVVAILRELRGER